MFCVVLTGMQMPVPLQGSPGVDEAGHAKMQ